MKHLRFLLLMAALLLPLSACAAPAGDGIVLGTDGRITGQITSDLGVPIELDLALPAAPPDQALTVEYRRFTKRELQRALRAIGQSDEGDLFADQTGCSYLGRWQEEASAPVSHEEAAQQAVEIGHALFAELGVDVVQTPRSVGRPYEWDDSRQLYWHGMSEPEAMSAYYEAQFYSPRRKRTRPEQGEYTVVDFDVLLDGVPVTQNCFYPAGYADEPDAKTGFSTTASVTVSDSGALVRFVLDYIPVVLSRSPLETPLPAWREAVEMACRKCSDAPDSLEDFTFFNENIGMDVTHYARRPILTGLVCRYETVTEFEWVPVWEPSFSYEILRNGYRY